MVRFIVVLLGGHTRGRFVPSIVKIITMRDLLVLSR